jgi:tRNA dimethylallyltransferase
LAQHIVRAGGPAPVILAADAFQIYRGMDIGTAKPPPDERAGFAHDLIDLVSPHDPTPFTVEDWLARADARLAELRAAGTPAIVVGGTGLYVQALLYGLFAGPPADPALRAELHALGPEALRARLLAIDPEAAARIHPADLRRTVRALEVHTLTGYPITALQQQWARDARPRPGLAVCVLNPPKETLSPRINARVKAMFAAGLVDEVAALLRVGPLATQPAEALGYKQLIPAVSAALAANRWPPRPGEVDDAREQIKILTRRFAKNQRTWLNRLGSTPVSVTLPPEPPAPDTLPAHLLAVCAACQASTPGQA